jgi:hypothetical protein
MDRFREAKGVMEKGEKQRGVMEKGG